MGNVLDAPITTKETEAGGGLGMRYAVSSMQGWRREMEVRFLCGLDAARWSLLTQWAWQDAHVGAIGLPGKADVSFFGVFDGHGGSTVSRTSYVSSRRRVASFCALAASHRAIMSLIFGPRAEKIVQTLAATPQYQEASDPTEWSRVFYSSIFRLDRALRTLMFHFGERSGSTAIMSLVTPSHIIVGNVGTWLHVSCVASCASQRSRVWRTACQAIRGVSWAAAGAPSRCQRITSPRRFATHARLALQSPWLVTNSGCVSQMGERRRIKRAGMTVSMQRVNGELAVRGSSGLSSPRYVSRDVCCVLA